MHFLALPAKQHDRFTPVHLRVLARLEFEGQEDLLDMMGLLFAVSQVAPQMGFAALVADRVRRISKILWAV